MRGPPGPSITTPSTPPLRIASSVASSSATRARAFWNSASRSLVLVFTATLTMLLALSFQIEAQQHRFFVRQITDDSAHRGWQFLHQGRSRDDLLIFCQGRLLMYVDHLQIVLPVQILGTDCVQVQDGLP